MELCCPCGRAAELTTHVCHTYMVPLRGHTHTRPTAVTALLSCCSSCSRQEQTTAKLDLASAAPGRKTSQQWTDFSCNLPGDSIKMKGERNQQIEEKRIDLPAWAMPTSNTASQAPNATTLAPSLGYWEITRLMRGDKRRASPYPSLPKNSNFPAFLHNRETLEVVFFFLSLKSQDFHGSPWFWRLGFNPSVRRQGLVTGCRIWPPAEPFSDQLSWGLDSGIHTNAFRKHLPKRRV